MSDTLSSRWNPWGYALLGGCCQPKIPHYRNLYSVSQWLTYCMIPCFHFVVMPKSRPLEGIATKRSSDKCNSIEMLECIHCLPYKIHRNSSND
ncbi:unnamed protein product [Haemonchus placei]|uniref:Uncharacterized protein n=1 Tax=Haemonchus placei TaxID=6290 RepID=A0A3P8AW95_HAEPC|nr:unnamed protein product [Haemonchus placei]